MPGWSIGAVAQLTQPFEPFGARILGTLAEVRGEQHQIEVGTRQLTARPQEILEIERLDLATGREYPQVMAQPLPIARIAIDDEQTRFHEDGANTMRSLTR